MSLALRAHLIKPCPAVLLDFASPLFDAFFIVDFSVLFDVVLKGSEIVELPIHDCEPEILDSRPNVTGVWRILSNRLVQLHQKTC